MTISLLYAILYTLYSVNNVFITCRLFCFYTVYLKILLSVFIVSIYSCLLLLIVYYMSLCCFLKKLCLCFLFFCLLTCDVLEKVDFVLFVSWHTTTKEKDGRHVWFALTHSEQVWWIYLYMYLHSNTFCTSEKSQIVLFVYEGAFDQLKQNATKARIPFYGR